MKTEPSTSAARTFDYIVGLVFAAAIAGVIAVALRRFEAVIPPAVNYAAGFVTLPACAMVATLYLLAKHPDTSRLLLVGYFVLTLAVLISATFVIGGMTGHLDF